MKFSELLALFSPAKTLANANDVLSAAHGQVDAVAALFAAAGLDLDVMLAAGPDSLKAHLASLSAKDEELATARAKIDELTGCMAVAAEALKKAEATQQAHLALLSSVGFDAAQAPAGNFAAAFAAHVSTRATELLSKRGHPAIAAPAPTGEPAPTADAKATAAFHSWKAMPKGRERDAFYAAHAEAIWDGFNLSQ